MTNKNNTNNHLLIFGHGYAASAIGRKVLQRFQSITVTNRTITSSITNGYKHLVFDGNQIDGALEQAIEIATHVLISIAPDAEGDPVLRAAEELLRSCANLQWVGYLSTVGVYGDHQGAWVDEETKCRPASARSVERLAAEKGWQKLTGEINIPLTIFRLSGIYGPGRNALVNMEKGRSRRLVKKGQVFNRIHRDDIATAMDKAIGLKAAGIFNITDDEPAPPQDVVSYVHKLHGIAPPPEIDFDTADITPMARSFYGENKRVSNEKSKADLAMQYAWPNYRSAFDAMWNEDTWR
ncbi:MAG: SDR family oxidoreductase [Rhizobiaceae bacterium]|nr:SDR family oxidoreductase [Rhizobiaceae bacterium]